MLLRSGSRAGRMLLKKESFFLISSKLRVTPEKSPLSIQRFTSRSWPDRIKGKRVGWRGYRDMRAGCIGA